jgi:flagellar basal-body rod protein FlgB
MNMSDINNKDMFMDRTSLLLSRALDFRIAKQEIISGNLANIDTPGYRPKEIRFEKELQKAMDKTYTRLRKTDPSHISNGPEIMKDNFNIKRMVTESKTTELNIDTEMAKMARNNLLYEASARLLSNRLRALKTVIEGTGR